MAITRKDVIYFVLTDRFYGVENPRPEVKGKINKSNPLFYHGGNFDGIVEKIPYLKNLGITALWITPVYRQIDLEKAMDIMDIGAGFNAVNPSCILITVDIPRKQTLSQRMVKKLHDNEIKLYWISS
jgi:alpha-amylase